MINKDWSHYRGAKPVKARDQLAEKSGGLHQKALHMQKTVLAQSLYKKRIEGTDEELELLREYRKQRKALRK